MRSSSVGLVEQLVEHFGGLIRNHGLRVGMRLPSVRALLDYFARECAIQRAIADQALGG